MNVKDLEVGQLYTTIYSAGASFVELDGDYPYHEVYEILPGEIFMVTAVNEIHENSSVEIEILFLNKKMLFTFADQQCNIGNVRRAESYDIPFMTLKEAEPGSNSTSLVKHIYPPYPQLDQGLLLTFLSFLGSSYV